MKIIFVGAEFASVIREIENSGRRFIPDRCTRRNGIWIMSYAE